jgi:hypothetical protein
MKEKVQRLKALAARSALVAGGSVFALQAHAASVLDATAKSAITQGFTDMKDTALDVVTTMWPIFFAIIAVMFGPKIVKRLAKMV